MKDASALIKELARIQPAPRSADWRKWFVLSAGGILAFAGANSLLDALSNSQMLNLQDPLLGISFRYLLPLLGAGELFVAWLCLFTNKRTLSLGLVAWLVVNFTAYRIGLWTMGWRHPWIFVGRLRETFNISPLLADGIIFQVILFLLAGSVILLLRHERKRPALSAQPTYFKIHCPACDGKTAFDAQWISQIIPCPHCGNPLPLNKPD